MDHQKALILNLITKHRDDDDALASAIIHSLRVKAGMKNSSKTPGRPDEYDDDDLERAEKLLRQNFSIREVEKATGINRGKIQRLRKQLFSADDLI